VALPGYRYQFPRDHFNHPDFQTEWWYYTGNLQTADGRRFGFELTFFRQAVDRPGAKSSIWQLDDVWLAHLALSDIGGRRFLHSERLNRTGPALAGASLGERRVWNGNWEVRWQGETQNAQAIADQFSLTLEMNPQKPPVIHGINGVSQKASGAGHASHYISFPRLRVAGTIRLDGRDFPVTGTAWMDHEFFTHQLQNNQTGWDWFSIQLTDNSELMLFRLRRRDGTVDPFSAGTYVDAAGRTRHLAAADFALTPHETWTSPATGAAYPIHWTIVVPSLHLNLDARTPLPSQELTGRGATYWEGVMDFTGTMAGRGYLEMTGYDKPFQFAN
jgi:predicted secreted hydrolase